MERASLPNISSNQRLVYLWEKVRQDDEASFAAIHSQLFSGLFCYAMKMIKDEEVVDDLLQELFIKFWVKRKTIGEIQHVNAYFFRSVRSMVLNYIKSTSLKCDKLSRLPLMDLEFSKEEIIIHKENDLEIRNKLLNAVNSLPKKQREMIYLRFYEGLEYNQIASVTGIRYQSVINHVYRATQSLRETSALKHIYAA